MKKSSEGGIAGNPALLVLLALAAASAPFVIHPELDIAISQFFHEPGKGFVSGEPWPVYLLRFSGYGVVALVALSAIVALIHKIVRFDRPSLIRPQVSLFLISTLALGPGLLVNGLLKAYWGRPRPFHVEAFGGETPFVPFWQISDYCPQNCSFVSGEASSAIWLIAVALVVPARWRGPAIFLVVAYATPLSIYRIAFGKHFATDILWAWGLMLLLVLAAHRLFFAITPHSLANETIEARLSAAGRWLSRLPGKFLRMLAGSPRGGAGDRP